MATKSHHLKPVLVKLDGWLEKKNILTSLKMNPSLRTLSGRLRYYSSSIYSLLPNVEAGNFSPIICNSGRRYIVSSPLLQKKKLARRNVQEEVNEDDEEVKQYNQLVHRAQLLPDSGHQVLIIQPYIKWGPKKKELTTPDLMLEEAKALIDSLPKWTCVDTIKVPTETLEKKRVFGTGKFDSLKEQIRKDIKISAVFVSINLLKGIQKKYLVYYCYLIEYSLSAVVCCRELETEFRVPIFDRYSIVLQIFKERAQTYEAKLQVALAEIPYLKYSLIIFSLSKASFKSLHRINLFFIEPVCELFKKVAGTRMVKHIMKANYDCSPEEN